ncbi:MAG: hypothetical protein IT292_03795 [Deltaproteobacteria bacterium]|nr:hypothetical protein [Deltaproteobacteria bacterium]
MKGAQYSLWRIENGIVTGNWENGAGNIQLQTGQALFVDKANKDYRMLAISPAVNAGVNVGYATDILGNPIKDAPDIGAYELQ